MKNIQFTIYELFGYIFPGVISLIGIYLAYWRFFLFTVQDWTTISSVYLIIIIIGYLFGHFIQAISNYTVCCIGKDSKELVWKKEMYIPLNVKAIIEDKIKKITGFNEKNKLNAKVSYDICKHYMMQIGKTETYNIYTYREGFYRGMCLGFLILTIGSFIRMTGSDGTIKILTDNFIITRIDFICIGFLSLIMMFFTFKRYQRFSIYRVKYVFYNFLALSTLEKKAK